jgi:hypothetical protein
MGSVVKFRMVLWIDYCTTLRLLLAGLYPSKEGLSQAEKLAQWQDAIAKINER